MPALFEKRVDKDGAFSRAGCSPYTYSFHFSTSQKFFGLFYFSDDVFFPILKTYTARAACFSQKFTCNICLISMIFNVYGSLPKLRSQ